MIRLIAPSDPLLQLKPKPFADEAMVLAVSASGAVMVACSVRLQPLASETSTV